MSRDLNAKLDATGLKRFAHGRGFVLGKLGQLRRGHQDVLDDIDRSGYEDARPFARSQWLANSRPIGDGDHGLSSRARDAGMDPRWVRVSLGDGQSLSEDIEGKRAYHRGQADAIDSAIDAFGLELDAFVEQRGRLDEAELAELDREQNPFRPKISFDGIAEAGELHRLQREMGE